MTQVQLYAVRVGRGYTATATTPTSAFGELESLLTAALASLSVQRIDATALGLASGDGFGALPLTSTEGSGG